MHHVRWVVLLGASFALAAGGCKKKDDGGAKPASGTGTGTASASASASGGSAGSAGSGAATDTTSNAAGNGAGAALKPVTDCPKSLSGHDDGLDRTIKKECGTVAVTGDYSIDGKLTIEGGVTLSFAAGASMTVGYSSPTKLTITGTAAAPVTFTTSGDKVAGTWKGVRLYENAARSSIDGLVMEFAGSEQGALTIDAVDVTVKNTTIRDATEFGLYVNDQGRIKDAAGNTFERAGKIAWSVPPGSVGGLAAGNTFKDAGAFVQIRNGAVEETATWQNPGTFYQVDGHIDVDGKNARAELTIAAGTELRFNDDSYLEGGYSASALISVKGTADKPVVMKGVKDGKSTWKGLGVYDKGELDLEGAQLSGGNQTEGNGTVFVSSGTLTIKDTKITSSSIGLSTNGPDAKVKSIDTTSFDGDDKAWVLAADQLGALGAGNSYGKGEIAEIGNGAVSHDQEWKPQAGLDIHATGNLSVDKAVLTLDAGVALAFDGDEFGVGYADKASLIANGTTDKPVILRGVRDEKGSWKGVVLYENSNDNKLTNLAIDNAENDAAVMVHGKAHATITNLACKGCTAGVTYECASQVTQTGIKMTGGGQAEVKPAC